MSKSDYIIEKLDDWYIGSTKGIFHKRLSEKDKIKGQNFSKDAEGYSIIPNFNDITSLFNGAFPKEADSLLYLPKYTYGNLYELKTKKETKVKGYMLGKDLKNIQVQGDLMSIMMEVEIESINKGFLPKVIIVDNGANMLKTLWNKIKIEEEKATLLNQ